MDLFILGENYLVELNKPEISTIKEFKRLIVRDKDRYKKQAQKEFTYIYHYCSFKSDYSSYSDEERHKKASTNAGFEEDYKVDKDEDVQAAIKVFIDLQDTRALRLIKGTYRAVDALTTYFNTVVVGTSKQAQELKTTIGGIGKIITDMSLLEKQVKEELKQGTRIKGDHSKGDDEDPSEEDMNWN